mmetsp:Transcript_25372/g.59004  ORF Transcript_25372/g.59004 Transcript_25372/m.59004 type:complete len:629 (-) Transcript_25372:50-1936(-)
MLGSVKKHVSQKFGETGSSIASAFEFGTSYTITFKDWRLTALDIFFTFCVVLYVAVRSLLLWSIIDYDEVAASYNSWTATQWTSRADSDAVSPHCGANPAFDLAPVDRLGLGGIAGYNHTCPRVTGADIMRQVGGEAQVTVWQQRRRSTAGCESGVGFDAHDVNGQPCFESHFIDGVEDLPLFLIHTVSASGSGIQRTQMSCMIVESIGGKELGRVQENEARNGWSFSLRQLLQYAGNVSLDDKNLGNEVPVQPGTKIRLRHTGFILTLRFRYWNYMAWPDPYWYFTSFPFDWQPSEPRCALEVELQPQAWGFLGADASADGSVLRSVARIQFLGSGQFGTVSTRLVVSSFVEAFVLMGIASTVTLRVAKLLYGDVFRDVTETSFEMKTVKLEHDAKSGSRLFGLRKKSSLTSTFEPRESRKGLRGASASSLNGTAPVKSQQVLLEGGGAAAVAAAAAEPSPQASQRMSVPKLAPSGPYDRLSPSTVRLLENLAELSEFAPTTAFDEDEPLLQAYLRRRLAGFSDDSTLKALSLQQPPGDVPARAKLSWTAEKILAQVAPEERDPGLQLLAHLQSQWQQKGPSASDEWEGEPAEEMANAMHSDEVPLERKLVTFNSTHKVKRCVVSTM